MTVCNYQLLHQFNHAEAHFHRYVQAAICVTQIVPHILFLHQHIVVDILSVERRKLLLAGVHVDRVALRRDLWCAIT